MQLTSFRVKGFKNLRQEIVLADLGPVNVLHGENNVGKSNLLQALWVLHWLIERSATTEVGAKFIVDDGMQANFGPPLADMFDVRATARPIELSGTWSLPATELPNGQVQAACSITLTFQINRVTLSQNLEVTVVTRERSRRSDQVSDAQAPTLPQADWPQILQWMGGWRGRDWQARFSLLHTDRVGQPTTDRAQEQQQAHRGILSMALQDRMFEARNTNQAGGANGWRQFCAATRGFVERFQDHGDIDIILDRKSDKGPYLVADLGADTRHRIRADALGSGVQQAFALLGHVFLSGVSILAIEEPELNLQYGLQLEVYRALATALGKPGAPDQLFLTSHSAAFDGAGAFFGMSAGADGPVVVRANRDALPRYLGLPESGLTATTASANVGWLATDKVVQVPQFVADALRAKDGAAVLFRTLPDGGVGMYRADDEAGWSGAQ